MLKQRPKDSDATQNVIIVDGVPQVGPDRVDKLKNLMRKLFKDFGTGIVSESFPTNDEGNTKG